ncbi:hypothetical protein BJ138DRAFT_1157535 [Hygrophoropsis aurantiaca]|uniref:Uncharacterized protein n=1 Tax=Hygrophoropsis aurantiaca TaxID=72124 RepID=A0ACB8A736_9AGAM|nr:hypothetical protein BJ138DRAFT_1157535 [Hygrophoropsis aurantiaca]
MRIRCPSFIDSMSDVSDSLEAITSVRKPAPKSRKVMNARVSKNHNTTRPRSSAGDDVDKKQRVMNAMKRERIRREAKKCDWTYAFVGNFAPSTSQQDLADYFKRCGRIWSLDIRCSGGLVMPAEVPSPAYYQGHAVHQYAVVIFTKPDGARKALTLNGTDFKGYQLVVSRSASDLPEIRQKVNQHLHRYRNRTGRIGQPRPLQLEPTVLLYENECTSLGSVERLERRNAFKIFGFSIPNTLM